LTDEKLTLVPKVTGLSGQTRESLTRKLTPEPVLLITISLCPRNMGVQKEMIPFKNTSSFYLLKYGISELRFGEISINRSAKLWHTH
jgi:hypothetical protein